MSNENKWMSLRNVKPIFLIIITLVYKETDASTKIPVFT